MRYRKAWTKEEDSLIKESLQKNVDDADLIKELTVKLDRPAGSIMTRLWAMRRELKKQQKTVQEKIEFPVEPVQFSIKLKNVLVTVELSSALIKKLEDGKPVIYNLIDNGVKIGSISVQ